MPENTATTPSPTLPLRPDAANLFSLYVDIAEKSGRLVAQFLERGKNGALPAFSDELGITQTFFQAWGRLLSDPVKLAEEQMRFWQDTTAAPSARCSS